MTDHAELKRLAEAVDLVGGYLSAQDFEEVGLNAEDAAFAAAANPAAILALIAECARYRQYGCDTCDGSGHLHRVDGEYFGECTSCCAYELEQAKRERDQLKAENEALREAEKPIPAGWALVPKEPTAEMVRFAGVCVPKIPSAQWRAMVCAAPEFAGLSNEVGHDR